MSHEAQAQFGRQAAYYAVSNPHASGDSLRAVVELAQPQGHERAIDIATGAGFTAAALSPSVRSVIAYDLTPAMLRETRALASQRQLPNVQLMLGIAEALPFANESFELVACRFAPHHFVDLPKALQEMARIVRPNGAVVIADTTCPEDAELGEWMNDVERRRDPSHVRNLSPSQWRQAIADAGLRVVEETMTPTPQTFNDWVRRSGTPHDIVVTIERDFRQAPPAAASAFGIQLHSSDIAFVWACVVLRAERR